MDLTPQVLDLLEQVRVAVVEDRLPDAEQLMLKARDLINAHETSRKERRNDDMA